MAQMSVEEYQENTRGMSLEELCEHWHNTGLCSAAGRCICGASWWEAHGNSVIGAIIVGLLFALGVFMISRTFEAWNERRLARKKEVGHQRDTDGSD